jgi:hypothetical protein
VWRKRCCGGAAILQVARGARCGGTGGCAPPSRAVLGLPRHGSLLALHILVVGFPLLECGPFGPPASRRFVEAVLTSKREPGHGSGRRRSVIDLQETSPEGS